MSTLCVGPNVIKSQQFKDAQTKYDLHESELEQIVHEWINTEGNEETFPSDDFIQSRIQGVPLVNASEEQVKLWERDFSTPRSFDTFEQAGTYKKYASQFFGSDSIRIVKNNSNKFTVSIAKPTIDTYTQEINTIKQTAIENGTFMKAPNGNPTNLTERQWLQVRTKEFKEWFGDWENNPESASKIVDGNGEPLVVYHGSRANDIKIFNIPEGMMGEDIGVFFSSDIKYAKKYGYAVQSDNYLYSAFLNIRKPKTNVKIDREQVVEYRVHDFLNNKKSTIDGLIGHDDWKGEQNLSEGTEFVVFNSNQIKSATDNIGTFSLEEDNIYQEHDRIGGHRDSKLNALLNVENTGISDLINILESSEYSSIIELLRTKNILFDNISVHIDNYRSASKDRRYEGRRAYYDSGTHTIHINADAQYIAGNASSVILHEILHAITLEKLKANPNARKAFQNIINEYVAAVPFSEGMYFNENAAQLKIKNHLEEFVADIWSNPTVIENLKRIKTEGTNISLWDKIKTFFTNLFSGIFKGTTTNSLMAKASVELSNLLDSEKSLPVEGIFREGELPPVKPLKPAISELPEHQRKFMEKQTKYLQQNKALEEAGLTTSEISEFAESIGFALSDYITWALEGKMENGVLNENWVFDVFPTLYRNDAILKKIKGMSRKEFVEYVGIGNLFAAVQEKYNSWEMNSLDMLEYVDAINENWDTIMRQAAVTFNENEDFSLVLVSGNDVKTQRNVENTDVDNYNESNEEGVVEDNAGNSLEHWQTQDNTTDKFTKISKLLKREIARCLELDANGNPVLNSWGHQKRVSLRPATEQIFNFTKGCKDINEMVQMLQGRLNEAPWLTQLLNRLTDTTGKEAMFQSQFYTTFKQSENVYNKGLTQKGVMKTIPVNRHPALNKVMRSLRTTFELGEHSLFTQNGVSKPAFELLKKNYEAFKESLNDETKLDARNNALRTMIQLLVGETESAVVLTDFDNNNILLGRQEIARISNAMNMIVETLGKEATKGNRYYNPLNTDKNSNGIYGRLQQVFSPFLKKSESETSSSAYSNGKTYQTHATPSWLSLFLERVNSPEGIAYLEQYYGASEFFKSNGVWNNWIIKQFMAATEDERTKMFQHHIEVEFNKKGYMRDMTSSEYMLSIATNYFANQKDGMANYPMPMLGNKPSNEFISLPKIGGSFKRISRMNYYTDNTIGEKDVDVFIGEKTDNPNELTFTVVPMEGTASGTNAELWIDRILVKKALDNRDKTYKIRIDGFNDPNGLMTQSKMLNILFNRQLPSNIKISEYDIERVVTPQQEAVIDALITNFSQELARIQTVMMREKAGITKGTQGFIKHWDTRGKQFQFLTVFNKYLNNNTEFGREMMKKLNGIPANDYVIEREAKKVLLKEMLGRTEEILGEWERKGILQSMMNINGIAKSKDVAIQQFTEMVWNYRLAEINLLQLLAVDKAFFKNEEDLQKRMPQVHAPGARVNKWTMAINGINNPYSVGGKVSADGLARTAMLKDIEGEAVKSNMLENIKEVFDRKLALLDKNSELYRITKAQYDNIYDKFEKEIVLTDAQAYRSVTSLRKAAHMLGKWDEHKEEVYQKIVSGTYDHKDIQALSQVIKPFVFTHMLESTEVQDAPIKTMPVPMQNKNSEYLIILADAILAGERTKRPNLLRVLNRIMEESAFDGRTYDENGNVLSIGTYNGKGIDVIQFVSAVKCGEKGALDLSSFMHMEEKEGEREAYTYMKSMLYQIDGNNRIIQNPEAYNPNSVRAFDFDYWSVQQEVDDHLLEHEQIDGSQKRAIIESDLETAYTDGSHVFYAFDDNGVHKQLTAKEFKEEYEQVYAQKIEYGIQKLAEEFKLNLGENGKFSRVDRNLAVSEMLQNEVMNNLSRYGLDMLQAVSLDENYEFVLPLGDPVMYKRIEQLLNSMIKNRINKQMIEGGPVVQVSNFGTTTELSTRFQDRNGNVLPTLKEYQEAHPEKFVEDYKKEVLKNQAGMAYMEVFCSIYDEELVNFMDKDGFIDVKQIEAVNPDLLKLISYRIPTEDKYSILPLKIVGFLPREAGSAIMFPADITLITGSDFDIDKMYVQRKHFNWSTDYKRFRDDAHSMMKEAFKEMNGKERNDEINMFLDNPELMKSTSEVQAKLYELYTKNNYRTNVKFPTKGEKYLDNKMIDMTWSVLTNESTLDKMLNPGGFDREKSMGYKVAAFKTGKYKEWSEMDGMTIDDLKKVLEETNNLDLTWIDTQITFYEQNNAASTALGMAAVQKSAHALLEGDGIQIQLSLLLNKLPEREFNVDFLADYGVDATEKELNDFLDMISKGQETEASAKHKDIYDVYKKAGIEFTVEKEGTDEGALSKGKYTGTYLKLANTVIGGNMLIDGRADANGILIGRTLGEFVAMFADAVKDPVANLMNINSQTMPVITSLIRLGVSFEDAALFLSQPIIKKALDKLNYENITGNYTTLNRVINTMLSEMNDRTALNTSNVIPNETLTREEMIEGLKGMANETVEFKVLSMLKNFMTISNEIKSLTTATRVNSIASAAGPLIIDNYIFQNKLESFSPYFLTKDGGELTLGSLYASHQMLDKLAQPFIGQSLVDKVFAYSPVNKEFLDMCRKALPMGKDKLFSNRANLSDFVDFVYSYMAAKAGIVETGREKLDYYINKFPSDFIRENFKAQYPENAFVQAIYRETQTLDDGSKMQVLSIGYTSLDETQKQKLRNGWYDLSKKNPKLAKDLFNYWFFRGGMTFNPRSGMALLPQQLRDEYYRYTDQSGKQRVLYRDRFESVDYMTMLRQFFQNNAGNYSLVPVKKVAAADVIKISNDSNSLRDRFNNVRSESGVVYAIKGDSKSLLFDTPAFRTSEDRNSLYFCIGEKKVEDEMCYIYEKVDALGNNDRYLEIDMSEIQEAMKVTNVEESEKDTEVNPNLEEEAEQSTIDETPTDDLSSPEVQKEYETMAATLASEDALVGQPITEEEKIANAERQVLEDLQMEIDFGVPVEEVQRKVEEKVKKDNNC